jgi:2-keto-3-deoxy-L-rhamnonate aldolase RhmA
MPVDGIRARLQQGHAVFGTFVMEFATPGVGALAAAAGAEFVFFDQQHTGWSLGDLAPSLWGCRAAGVAAGVRVPAVVPWMIGAALDSGASLIMVPAVDDAEQARAVVTATRYPPSGERAVTFSFASDAYRPPADAGAEMARRNAETVVVLQIETAAGLDNADQIAAADGVDVLWVGDNDLATALGVPGRFGDPRYLRALDRVAEAADAAGKTAGFTTADPAAAEQMLRRGYRMLCCGNDIKLFHQGLAAGLAAFRRAAEPAAIHRD